MPIPYTLKETRLYRFLEKLNGVYIPGDSEAVLTNQKYTDTLRHIVQWAQKHNDEVGDHFPLIAVSYGYLSLIQNAMRGTYG